MCYSLRLSNFPFFGFGFILLIYQNFVWLNLLERFRQKGLRPFDFIIFSYAEGAQGASNASSLWIYARGGVRFTPYSIGVAHLNRPVARLCISFSSGISMFARESETRGIRLKSVFLYRAECWIPNQSKWIRLTADCREFVRWREANVQFRFTSVEEPTNDLSNFAQINRRGHSNYTTKAYA